MYNNKYLDVYCSGDSSFKAAISTSLFFEMKGYKLEYHTLIDAYDENRDKDAYNHCNLVDFVIILTARGTLDSVDGQTNSNALITTATGTSGLANPQPGQQSAFTMTTNIPSEDEVIRYTVSPGGSVG